MIRRLGVAAFALLVSIDILACTLWLAPLYVVGLADRPSGRKLISSYVGMAAANGYSWGRIAAAAIDRLALIFGSAPGHCERCRREYLNRDD